MKFRKVHNFFEIFSKNQIDHFASKWMYNHQKHRESSNLYHFKQFRDLRAGWVGSAGCPGWATGGWPACRGVKPIKIHANPWKSMEIHRNPSKSMKLFRKS